MDDRTRKALARYTAELFADEDEVLAELRRAIADSDLPEIFISPEEGRLLQVLLKAIGARRVVELGTLGGYSAIWMARALPPDGRLVTIEKRADRAEFARRFVERAGLSKRIEVLVGEAAELLERVSDAGPFDAVFIDADKEGYPRYLDWCAGNVRSGGLIMADNAFIGGRVIEARSGAPDVEAIREFNRRIAEDPRYTSIVVPIRDGVAIAIVN